MGIISSDLYSFLRGPGFVIAILVFLAGCVFRVIQFGRWTRKIHKSSVAKPAIEKESIIFEGKSAFGRGLLLIKHRLRSTIFGSNPVMGVVSLIFHLLLFITPVFLPAHNILADLSFGTSLPAFPERLMDIFTVILMAFGLFFLLRRIFVPRVRALTTVRDYCILLLVMAPFVTAFFAYHQLFNYQAVLRAHMIIGEIAIMVVPFTSLGHMPFLILSRFFISAEYAWKPGNRRW